MALKQESVDDCSIFLILKLISRKWIPYILSELIMTEKMHFSDFQRVIEGKYGERISSKVLSSSLDLLEKKGIIQREVIQEKPVRVQYFLTEQGDDLKVVFGALKGYGIKWGDIKQKKCKTFTCIHNAVPALDIEKARELLYTRTSSEA